MNIPSGDYVALFVNSSNNREIASLKFSIRSDDWFSQIFQWTRSENLILYASLFIPLIGFIYKILYDKWIEDRKKIEAEIMEKRFSIERKFNWEQHWMKHIVDIQTMSEFVFRGYRGIVMKNDYYKCLHLSYYKKSDYDDDYLNRTDKLLKSTIFFTRSLEKFYDEVNLYSFDNIKAEWFIIYLNRELRNMLNRIFGINWNESDLFKDYKKGHHIRKTDEYAYYLRRLQDWITEDRMKNAIANHELKALECNKINCCSCLFDIFGKDHLLNFIILYTYVNGLTEITYSDKKVFREGIRKRLKEEDKDGNESYQNVLGLHISGRNKDKYEDGRNKDKDKYEDDKSSYYDPFDEEIVKDIDRDNVSQIVRPDFKYASMRYCHLEIKGYAPLLGISYLYKFHYQEKIEWLYVNGKLLVSDVLC
jgi:hypothetical protein